jgi:hypothetical protein
LFLLVGEKFEAVVPFMGESVTDGTLATFLKSMLSSLSLSGCGSAVLCEAHSYSHVNSSSIQNLVTELKLMRP